MDARPIGTELEYEAALREIDGLMDAEAGTPEGERLDFLVSLVQRYEAINHPIGPAEPNTRSRPFADPVGPRL